MEANESMVFVGENVNMLVNQPMEDMLLWTKLSVLAVTLAVNIAAAVLLRREDDTPINRLIIWDCMINEIRNNRNNAHHCRGNVSLLLGCPTIAWDSI
jgi:hypothetical protein